MTTRYRLNHLDDQMLMNTLGQLLGRDHRLTAELLAHLAEVDARKLYLQEACASMYVYCTAILRMSEGAAYRRIEAARTARAYPVLFDRVAAGEVNLTTITLLTPYLTDDNCAELIGAAVHKGKRDIQQMLAERFPKPDVAASVRKLPQPRTAATSSNASAAPLFAAPAVASISAARPRRPVVEPLAPQRYKIEFTASQQTHDKLRAAQDLLRHQVPNGDVATVIDQALGLLVDELMRKRFAKSKGHVRKKRSSPANKRSRHIPSAIKREVVERDGLRCSFVAPSGRHCPERGMLELHHVDPFGKGGPNTSDNIQIVCRAHNMHAAVRDYGAAAIARYQLVPARVGNPGS